MILKLSTYGGWRYLDNIATVDTTRMDSASFTDTYSGKGRMFSDTFLKSHKLKDGKMECTYPNTDFPIAEIMVQFKDGSTESYLSDGDVFLMSDIGKTIERIN